MPTDVGKIPHISLIAGKEFRNWVVKELDPFSQALPTVKKRRRNIVLSFSHDSVTTARLKTYNMHLDIGAQRARDQMGAETDRGGRRDHRRRIRREMVRERGEWESPRGDWILREPFDVPLARRKTIVNPRSTADSELGRSGNGLSPDQR
ncbi:hypothetical protein TNCV_4751511 [Trichonephila clavipes]|nr:hypothetical protein TNCV_4751511 [Trichonephila clavipes]